MKISIEQVKQMLKNQEEYLKAHPELKNLSVDELKERLYKFIIDGLPKIRDESELIKLEENKYIIKKVEKIND